MLVPLLVTLNSIKLTSVNLLQPRRCQCRCAATAAVLSARLAALTKLFVLRVVKAADSKQLLL